MLDFNTESCSASISDVNLRASSGPGAFIARLNIDTSVAEDVIGEEEDYFLDL